MLKIFSIIDLTQKIQKPRVFGNLVRDVQELQKGELEFSELLKRYPNVKIGLLNIASNWVLTGEK